jgi:hypothetical protein
VLESAEQAHRDILRLMQAGRLAHSRRDLPTLHRSISEFCTRLVCFKPHCDGAQIAGERARRHRPGAGRGTAQYQIPYASCAVGYAMYKTLFKNGYLFSYDLSEIAQYYVAYRRLMQHWEAIMPGVMHQVSYEDLVVNQLVETRKLLDYCDLNWEEACVAFNQNPEASTTASASQVRRPIHDSSILQWRYYEQQLSELSVAVKSAGYCI